MTMIEQYLLAPLNILDSIKLATPFISHKFGNTKIPRPNILEYLIAFHFGFQFQFQFGISAVNKFTNLTGATAVELLSFKLVGLYFFSWAIYRACGVQV